MTRAMRSADHGFARCIVPFSSAGTWCWMQRSPRHWPTRSPDGRANWSVRSYRLATGISPPWWARREVRERVTLEVMVTGIATSPAVTAARCVETSERRCVIRGARVRNSFGHRDLPASGDTAEHGTGRRRVPPKAANSTAAGT